MRIQSLESSFLFFLYRETITKLFSLQDWVSGGAALLHEFLSVVSWVSISISGHKNTLFFFPPFMWNYAGVVSDCTWLVLVVRGTVAWMSYYYYFFSFSKWIISLLHDVINPAIFKVKNMLVPLVVDSWQLVAELKEWYVILLMSAMSASFTCSQYICENVISFAFQCLLVLLAIGCSYFMQQSTLTELGLS